MFSRRDFLKKSGAIVVAGSLPSLLSSCGGGTSNNVFTNPATSGSSSGPLPTPTPTPLPVGPALVQPPEFRSVNGLLSADLDVKFATNLLNGQQIFTRTFNGLIPGQTLRANQGDTIKLTLNNQLPPNTGPSVPNTEHDINSTNLHTHGLHVSPRSPSDDVLIDIEPGTSFDYTFNIPSNHWDGSFWYHPHRHGSVAVQVMSGMAGMLIIQGPLDQVPEVAAAKDVVMVIQQITIINGEAPSNISAPIFNPQIQTYTVNGQLNPVVVMKTGEVQRWRLLNADWYTFMPVSLTGHLFHQLAFDGVTFPSVVDTAGIMLTPGNRADVLVKAGAPGIYKLVKLPHYQGFPAPLPQIELLTVVVTPEISVPMGIPTTLPAPAILSKNFPAVLDAYRTLTFGFQANPDGSVNFPISPAPGQPFMSFDPNRVDQTMQLNAQEEWTLLNVTTDEHPFHIHINPFLLTEVDYVPVADPIWMDTAAIPKVHDDGTPGQIKFKTRFTDFTGQFVLHCHILDHEDLGMMELIQVV